MLTPEKRAEAFAAIKAAQPHWTDRDVRYAIEKMPTRNDYAYVPGSPALAAAIERHRVNLDAWLTRVLHTKNAEPFPQKFG